MKVIVPTSLYDAYGNRKYLTRQERKDFLTAARETTPEVAAFCSMLAYTGARISEALATTPEQLDFDLQCIVIESIKKRSAGIFRAVPVPVEVLVEIDKMHKRKNRDDPATMADGRIWNWSRTTAWSKVIGVMSIAGLTGIRATPKGLRHAFGVSAIHAGVALNMVQKWMGHADISTTSIYANAMGAEELLIAQQLWETFQ